MLDGLQSCQEILILPDEYVVIIIEFGKWLIIHFFGKLYTEIYYHFLNNAIDLHHVLYVKIEL